MTVREYLTADGKNPFRGWLGSFESRRGAGSVARAALRAWQSGRPQERRRGVWEARVMFGPGDRIYFGKDGDSIVVLLAGGDTGSQATDIARARGFWRDYLEAKRHGKAT